MTTTAGRARGRLRAAAPLVLDVTSAEVHRRRPREMERELGGAGLDGVVNNAGIGCPAPVELLPVDDLRRQLDVNVVGQVAVTQATLPLSAWGMAGSCSWARSAARASQFAGAYYASKLALEAIGDALRQELDPEGSRDPRRAEHHLHADLGEGDRLPRRPRWRRPPTGSPARDRMRRSARASTTPTRGPIAEDVAEDHQGPDRGQARHALRRRAAAKLLDRASPAHPRPRRRQARREDRVAVGAARSAAPAQVW